MGRIVLRRGPWEPLVEERDGALVYLLPVASGFSDWMVEFGISPEDLEVLQGDEWRYRVLFAVLHARWQALGRVEGLQKDAVIGRVLHGAVDEVVRLVAEENAAHHGAVSAMLGRQGNGS